MCICVEMLENKGISASKNIVDNFWKAVQKIKIINNQNMTECDRKRYNSLSTIVSTAFSPVVHRIYPQAWIVIVNQTGESFLRRISIMFFVRSSFCTSSAIFAEPWIIVE